MIDLRASPFFLSEESITWVQGALSSMTPEEKIGQLFCITAGRSSISGLPGHG